MRAKSEEMFETNVEECISNAQEFQAFTVLPVQAPARPKRDAEDALSRRGA